jgi:DNA invertase Pin-like site-specific DNA recombinase
MLRSARSAPHHVVALYRVSTAEQGHSGLGLEAQQASVRTFITAQGWTLIGEFSDSASGKDDRRPGFQAALARCRQLGAILVAARLDRITRRAHTLSLLLEDGISIRAADMPGADDLMMRIYAAMAQKERELISARTKAALAAAKARGTVLGGDRGYRPSIGPDATAAARVRREEAERAAHRLVLEVEAIRGEGITSLAGLAQALTERGVATPRGGAVWTHTTVARVQSRAAVQIVLPFSRTDRDDDPVSATKPSALREGAGRCARSVPERCCRQTAWV